jgi:hypothetical protein
MIALPRRRTIRGRNHVHRQELSQDLRIELVALARRFGDHAHLLGMGEHRPVRQRLDQPHEPFVAGGRLDDRLEGAQPREEAAQRRLVLTEELATLQDLAGLIHDANRDRLLV